MAAWRRNIGGVIVMAEAKAWRKSAASGESELASA